MPGRWFWTALALMLTGLNGAQAADRLRIAAQATGTLAWELDVIKAHGLAEKAGLDLQISQYAAPEAGRIALQAGAADIVLADVMFVAQQRALGGALVFAPYTTALGAVMAPTDSPIHSIEDLKGRKIGVAGGPLDKSWLLLRALALRAGFDLSKQSEPAYGAPRLLAAKAEQGELAAVLNYWNICADLEISGFRRAIEMTDVERALGASAPAALVGYAFDGHFASAHPAAIASFLDISTQARQILADSPEEWRRIGAHTGAASPAALELYRTRYSAGARARPLAAEEADARILFRAIAKTGNVGLTAGALELDAGTYWRGGAEATH